MANKDDFLRCLQDGEARALAKLTETKPDTQEYMILLQNLAQQRDLAEHIRYSTSPFAGMAGEDKSDLNDLGGAPAEDADGPTPDAPDMTCPVPEDEVPEEGKPETEEATAETEEGKPETEEGNTEPAKVYTKEEVRARLATAANERNVDVAAVMDAMGFHRLSDVPADRYPELLEKAGA